jgi:RimJ/RimL family protein N-acetyltransferase
MLRGRKVVLREFRKEDAGRIQEWIGNENITKYLGFLMFPQTLEETEAYVERQLHKERVPSSGEFVIALADDPQLEYIGAVGLHKIDWRNRNCELGIVIGREEMLGQGLGAEAIDLILVFAFDFLNMHKVNLTVFEYNERAHHCYLKCGFKDEGRVRQQRYYDGRYWDMIFMGITRDEYVGLRNTRIPGEGEA